MKKGLTVRYLLSTILVVVITIVNAMGQNNVEFEQRSEGKIKSRAALKHDNSATAEPQLGISRGKEVDPMQVSTLFGYAVEYYLIGDRKQALEIFDNVRRLTSDSHASSRYYLALISQSAREIAKAREHIDRAVVLDSTNIDFRRLQAIIMLEGNDFALASPALGRLLKEKPRDIEIHFFYLLALYNCDKKAEMIDRANAFENTFGFDPRVSSLKSQYYIDNKRFEDLLKYNTLVSQTQPTADNLVGLARVQASLGMDSLAVGNYTKALSLSSDFMTRSAFADYKRVKGDCVGAYELFRPLLMDSMVRATIKINIFEDLFKAGLINANLNVRAIVDSVSRVTPEADFNDFYIDFLLYNRDIDAALVQLQKAMTGGFISKEKRIYLMQIYFEKKQLDAALEVATKLHDDFPMDSQIMGMIIFLNMEIGDIKASLKMADYQLKVAPNDSLKSVAYTSRGDLYQHFNQTKKAFADYKKAVHCDSLNATALNNWAYFTSLLNDVSEKELLAALQRSNTANQISELNPTFIDTTAWILYRLKQYSAARQKILLALGLQKGTPSADLLLHAGDIFFADGERDRAVDYWRQALEAGAKAEDIERRLNQKP